MRALAVGAHPDDIEILCAGTLLRYRQAGHEVTVAIATNGDQGHFQIPPAELAETRRGEAEASAAVLGAKLIWMNYHDELIFPDQPTRFRFIEMVRQAQPDVVLTHNPEDYHQDHRTVAELMFVSTFMATLPQLECPGEPTHAIPPIYYMDSLGGAAFVPEEYVDITSVMDDKLRMMRCHESQVKWLSEHDGIDIVELILTVARFRGLACNVRYAEGFRRLNAWPRNPTTRLLP
jgi:LmbE family N-acetylglucosaminyl deacetylase